MDLKENAYRPISFWSWNELMQEQELRAQIRDFKDKGFGGFFIHSRAGRLIPYMGVQWLNACKQAIDEAKKQGLDVWLYDEDGWPSGFAGGIVNGNGRDFWARHLIFSNQKQKQTNDALLCCYKKSEDGYARCEDDASAELYCYERLVPTYVDLMNPAVTEEFINSTHRVYKEHFGSFFGSTIKGIFTDEPQLLGDFPWSRMLADRYSADFGSDILDELWKLYTENGGYSFKYRYRGLCNSLMHESFVRPINEWCKRNRIVFTGHFASEDGLVAQLHSNGGVMPFYNDMGLPGIDHLGNRFASINLMKQVTSVAHRKGINHVLSESFGCSGWEVSFGELLSVASWQAAFGVNTICTHLSAYSIIGRRKRDYPAFFSYQEPWWQDMKQLNASITRLNTILSSGSRITHTAVVHPMRSAWCVGEEKAKYISSDFRELQNHLSDLHIDFDLIDEFDLSFATLLGGELKSGNISYNTVIVPKVFTLSSKTVRLIYEFSKNGGSVYFIGGRPETIEGDYNHPDLGLLFEIEAAEVQNSRIILQKLFRKYPIARPYALLDTYLENEVQGVVCRYIENRSGAWLFCFNPSRSAEVKAYLCHEGQCSFEDVSVISGESEPMATYFDDKRTYSEISIKAGQGMLIRITDSASESLPAPADISKITLKITDARPMSDNALTLDMGAVSLLGEPFSEKKYILNCTDEIYSRIKQFGSDATLLIEYTFTADFKSGIPSIALAYEKNRYVSAKVNGVLAEKECGWFVDKGIIRFNIGNYVKNGENKIELRYIIPNTHKVNDLEDKFESERNRFFYNVEPENIYLLGDFDVLCRGNICEKPDSLSVAPSGSSETFILTDSAPKHLGDMTPQGLWFYRGDIAYETEVEYHNNGRYYISVEDFSGVFISVLLEGREIGSLVYAGQRLDITDYLSFGTNKIRLELRGSNRNLMGPHHHIKGRLNFVGPDSFAGVKGWEDFLSPEITDNSTYTDSYSFVPLKIGRVELSIISHERL